MKTRRMLPLSTLGLGLLLVLPGHAQDAAEYQFSEIIDVELINVEVWVTDKQGRTVHGLPADAFEVLEDGEPVEISHFAEIQGNRPVLTELEQVLSEPQDEAPPPPPSAPDGEPSHLVVYFDQLHLLPSSRKQAIEDLRDFLLKKEVPPERVLILSQDESLTTEATFGSSWSELDEALSRLSKSLPRGGLAASEKRLAVKSLNDLWEWARGFPGDPCNRFLPRATTEIEAYAAETRQRIAVTLEHLASTASFLTGVPGVKTLIFVSDALERAPGTDLIGVTRDYCPVGQESSLLKKSPMFLLADELSQEFRTLTRHANANRVTIYALQTEGLDYSFSQGAEQRSSPGYRPSLAFDSAKRIGEREGMSVLASETGGRTIFNRNTFGAELTQIAREMSTYYSLAYEPRHGGDQREHEIEVRLKQKGLEARHRRGYRDKSPDTQMSERLQAAIYLGLVDNPLGVRLGAGAVRPAGEKEWLSVPLHVLVPAEKIVFLPSETGVVAQLSVQVSTRNTVDQKGLFDHRAYRINWKTEADQELVAVALELEVPPGVHLVAVGVRDDASRQTSVVSTTLEIHGAAAGSAG